MIVVSHKTIITTVSGILLPHGCMILECVPGYYPPSQQATDHCEPCPRGTYKQFLGGGDCYPCPPGTSTPVPGATSAGDCGKLQ